MAITTDIWTSDSNIGWITLTAHFISDDELKALVLSHTAENIGSVLNVILTEWAILDKIVEVLTDSARSRNYNQSH